MMNFIFTVLSFAKEKRLRFQFDKKKFQSKQNLSAMRINIKIILWNFRIVNP